MPKSEHQGAGAHPSVTSPASYLNAGYLQMADDRRAAAQSNAAMLVAAAQKVADGLTTVDEVIRSVYAPGVELDGAPLAELMPAKPALLVVMRDPAQHPTGGEGEIDGFGRRRIGKHLRRCQREERGLAKLGDDRCIGRWIGRSGGLVEVEA